MKIAFISRHDNSKIGGIERVTDILANQFTKDGHEVYWVCLINENPIGACPKTKYSTIYFPEPLCNSQKNRDFLQNFIDANHIDILINQYGAHEPESCLFLSPNNVKKISVIHTDPRLISRSYFKYLWYSGWRKRILLPLIPILRYRYNRIRKSFYKYLIQESDNVVLLCNDLKKSYSVLEKSDKVLAINNPNIFKSQISNIDSFDKKKSILFVGRLDIPTKAPDEVLHIFRVIEKKYPEWHLNIVGDGPDRKKLEFLAKKLNIKNFTFTGYVDPNPYYKEGSLLLLTSTNEGFGMVIIESMAHKCVPIVYDTFPAASDIIDDGVNGLLIRPKDRKSMIKAIISLIEKSRVRMEIANAAYDKSLYFSPEIIAKKWYSLFERLLSKNT